MRVVALIPTRAVYILTIRIVMATVSGASNMYDHTVEVINFIVNLLGLPIDVVIHKFLHVEG